MDKKYVVYQHVTPDGMYYFGQTNDIKRRWRNNGAEYKRTALQPYIEKFGWENIQHIVLFENQSKEDALWIENFLIETAREDGVCINKNRSGNISKEEGYQQQRCKQYYETNKDKIKQYYETNKEKIQERKKQYYEDNKGQILEQHKQYYETNKDKIREQHKQYREQNKGKIKQKYQKRKLLKQLQPDGCLPLW